ncbi:MAG: type I-U CRISPR-associated protein Csb2, partial [Myxococcota bacterium]
MLEIEVLFLAGRYTATAYNDRDRAEWPPHPARLFSALVATWAEDEGEAPEAEQAALEWLEALPPPRVVASGGGERTVAPVFVPVNDTAVVSQPDGPRAKLRQALLRRKEAEGDKDRAKADKAIEKARTKLAAATARVTAAGSVTDAGLTAAEQMIPGRRLRQARTFPTVVPWSPRVGFVWDATPSEEVRRALSALCARVVSLGHSSSFVLASTKIREELPEGPNTHAPDPDGDLSLRVTSAGQLHKLVRAYQHHRGVEMRTLPAQHQRYRRGSTRKTANWPSSVFSDDWVVFVRSQGDRYSLTRAVQVAGVLRKTLMAYGEDPLPEVLTGHTPEGEPLPGVHAAFVPLPYVASEYATGQIMGVALVFPREVDEAQRRVILAAIGRWEASARKTGRATDETPPLSLFNGSELNLKVRRVLGEARASTLKAGTWCRPSRRWATATPVALDRHPGRLNDRDLDRRRKAFAEAEATIARACV